MSRKIIIELEDDDAVSIDVDESLSFKDIVWMLHVINTDLDLSMAENFLTALQFQLGPDHIPKE